MAEADRVDPEVLFAYDGAVRDAVAGFGIEASRIAMTAVSENVTYRVDGPGSPYVLRLHRPGYHTIAELDSERVWLQALGEAGIAVPAPKPAPDGRYYLPIDIPALGETRYAGLANWVEGEVVVDALDQPDARPLEHYLAHLGSLMGAMHNQSDGWTPPPTFRRHRLDADGFFGDDPWWGRFWDHPDLSRAEQRVLMKGRDDLRSALERYGSDPGTFGMIHADLHIGNVVTSDEAVSVIDFDDAGFGWHQYDMAVALFHTRLEPDQPANERAFTDAYRSVRAIGDEDLALLPMFVMIRGMALIGWKAQRPEVSWPADRFDALKTEIVDRCAALEVPC